MRVPKTLAICIITSVFALHGASMVNAQNPVRQKINFNYGWQFIKIENDSLSTPGINEHKQLYDTTRNDFASQFLNEYILSSGAASSEIMKKEVDKAIADFHKEYPDLKDKQWTSVVLPHTAVIEPVVSQKLTWEGICYYRKTFSVGKYAGKKLTIEFEGAMQQTDVWLNGHLVLQHKGGYTPFSIDLTNLVDYGKSNEIIVRLDNHADKNFPIGKDQKKNGFTYWSGLYRSTILHVTNPVHITDAVKADKTGGGGIFFRTPEVSKTSATALIRTNIVNEGNRSCWVHVRQVLIDASGRPVRENLSESVDLPEDGNIHIDQHFAIDNPLLWHPDHPYLYKLKTTVFAGDQIVDELEQNVGFRKLSFSREDGFKINGEPMYLVGTNRHQDYPYLGVALSKNANYRDMKKIKDAGYNAVRLSHYPQDPAVYDAADELGIMLLDGIPGWQFFNNNDIFKQRVYRDIRDMIHRDRNHPSIILWEANLNESYPPDDFRIKCHELVHQDLPAGEYFTTGETYGAKNTTWDVAMNNWYDPKDSIFRNSVERVQDIQPHQPGLIKEYSDWEFGAWSSTTRSSRATGEKAMLQALWNTLWEHNADIGNYSPYSIGDFTWAMYDNYISNDKKLYEWGTEDYFRLPKFTEYFFQSQTDYKPMVFIANWWTPKSTREKVIILSNCDKVILKINNKIVGEQSPDNGPDTFYGVPEKGGTPFDGGNCKHLKHPPFTYRDIAFEPGVLKAEGYIKGVKVTEQIVRTPDMPVGLTLLADFSGKQLVADGADALFIHASVTDKNGTVTCLDNSSEVEFQVTGGAKIIGPSIVKARGGIASIIVQSNSEKPGKIEVTAKAAGLKEARLIIKSYPSPLPPDTY